MARGPWGKRYFFEAIGGGLFADYVRAAKGNAKKSKKVSKEQEMARHVSLLRGMLARLAGAAVEDRDRRRRYFRPLHSLGSDEHSLSWSGSLFRIAGGNQRWPTRFRLCARSRPFASHGSSQCAACRKKHKFPLRIRRFRQLRLVWKGSTLHLDDEAWPRKKQKPKNPSEIEITVKPSALVILQLRVQPSD
jgi:hypothetical protein